MFDLAGFIMNLDKSNITLSACFGNLRLNANRNPPQWHY